jgi:hypothetical protein
LFNSFGRQERNSSIEILEAGPERVKVRWTYYGVNMETGQRAYRGEEDFCAYPNGLIVRRQTFETLLPDDPRGYAREPMELIGLSPAGKCWRADGTEPEPADWQIEWARDGRSGLASVRAPHDGSRAEFEVDYILIKADELPLITVTAGANESLSQ